MPDFAKLRRWGLLFAGLLSFIFVLITATQIVRVYQWGATLHSIVGYILAGLLVLAIVGVLILPWLALLQLPQALTLPKTEEEYPIYQAQMSKRLQRNALLKAAGFTARDLATDEGYQRAMEHLHGEAHKVMSRTARHIFLVTAISQNGKLDGLAVLFTQMRMVWELAKLYHQRPAISDMARLYVNVIGATLLAAEVDDLDVTEQVEPLVNSFMKTSATKSVPWAGSVAQLVTDSMMEGTINAFFTLRVGVLTQQYCAPSGPVVRKTIRLRAYKEAAGMLGKIVVKTSGEVVSAVLKSITKSGVSTVKSGAQVVKETANLVKDAVVSWSLRVGRHKGVAAKETTLIEEGTEEDKGV